MLLLSLLLSVFPVFPVFRESSVAADPLRADPELEVVLALLRLDRVTEITLGRTGGRVLDSRAIVVARSCKSIKPPPEKNVFGTAWVTGALARVREPGLGTGGKVGVDVDEDDWD
jgi:hypothetical protein